MAKLKEMIDVAGSAEQAEAVARELVKKDDRYLMDLQLILAAQGKIEESWEVQQKAEQLKPKDKRVQYNKGWHVMLQGDQLEGFKLMNEGRSVNLWGNKHIGTNKPLWDGKSVGNHILFNCEAGFGDEVGFVRFAKQIERRGNRVVVICSNGLTSLFARSLNIPVVTGVKEALSVYHDCWVPSMLAPVMLNVDFDDLSGKPYLTPDSKLIPLFSGIMSDKLNVGIRWRGVDGDDYINRLFPLEQMLDAVSQDHVSLYSLQKDNHEYLPDHVTNLDPMLTSWENTAAIIYNLDLVITSCTSVAHVAAAMGKPTWIVIPVMMYYLWCYPGDKSPWYDSVTLFRQEKYGNWDKPFNEIKEKLRIHDTVIV